MIRPAPILAIFLLAAPALAQGFSALKGHDSNAPIDISSDHIEVQDRADRAIWVGNVHAVQGDMTMDAARMTVAYTHATTPGADPQIQRIDASGGVTVVSPTERAKGSFGIYDLNRKLITLIGGVTLTRGTNVVNGARLVIDMNTGRATVDGNAVAGGTTAASGGRVTGHFSVPKRAAATTPPVNGSTPPK
ncbi:MAG TPA: LptA/OstA family protein [Sphingomonas sp.]|uniref:LptA/OstA family protein n=1 Tax=Sphingomonas sp. TaxID=28214 RepID=UPI002C7E9C3D|nr:LptA/OstA family protein [Sphingomonas sp.]HMI20408.1 LptA/OstA family protein [Sphingomonas sp.]